jgi:hypothetical protein
LRVRKSPWLRATRTFSATLVEANLVDLRPISTLLSEYEADGAHALADLLDTFVSNAALSEPLSGWALRQ